MKRFITIIVAVILITGLSRASQAVPVDDLQLDVSGTVQFLQTWSQLDGANDQLDVHRLRLGVKGNINENICLVAELEGSDNVSPAGTVFASPGSSLIGVSTAAGARYAQKDMGSDSRIVILKAILNYWDNVTVVVGQMPRGSNYELGTPVKDLETISYSTNVGFFGKYVRGVCAKVNLGSGWKWGICGDNGTGGISGSIASADDKPSWGTKFVYAPTKKFEAKVFYRRVFESLSMPDAHCYGAGTIYKKSGLNFMAEYYGCLADPMNGGTKSTLEMDAKSWFTHASYMIPESKFQLVARYNKFDKAVNNRVSGAVSTGSTYDFNVTTLGVIWHFDKNTKLKVMRDFVDGADNDCLDVMLQLSF